MRQRSAPYRRPSDVNGPPTAAVKAVRVSDPLPPCLSLHCGVLHASETPLGVSGVVGAAGGAGAGCALLAAAALGVRRRRRAPPTKPTAPRRPPAPPDKPPAHDHDDTEPDLIPNNYCK
ncbi:hypothetical protein EVAR_93732_1 [Eumeta japonica]|uniref:Uncharacterized protein n=1 Tax=Eumeta variegata TaxID=151549 RepID=A0A4C1U2Y0_EUMVA|nr:hypothetical protein EVAR_93732_1 [Eumeta japonica]